MGGDSGIVWFLRTSQEELDGVRLVSVEGRVSRTRAPDLLKALDAASAGGLVDVIVDLSGVDYINGAGLQAFETVATYCGKGGGTLVVCGLRAAVQAVFDLAGDIPHLAIEPSRGAARSRLSDPGAGPV